MNSETKPQNLSQLNKRDMKNEPKNGTMLQNEPKLYNYIDVFCVIQQWET